MAAKAQQLPHCGIITKIKFDLINNFQYGTY
jgi:hypothetical protein